MTHKEYLESILRDIEAARGDWRAVVLLHHIIEHVIMPDCAFTGARDEHN
jgi:hypothetical protein